MPKTELSESGLSLEALHIHANLFHTGDSEGKRLYTEHEAERLGVIEILLKAGMLQEEIAYYFELEKRSQGVREQITILRKYRGVLLEHIHQKQQILDHIDYIIWEKSKQNGRSGL